MEIAPSVLHAIGRTPLMRLSKVVPAGAADVVVKLEFYNPTGSYKDRMALAMIEGAERRGVLKPGMRVVEFTGGSTGSSLAMVCAVKGYRCLLLSSDAFAEEKLRTMRAFGAELRIVPSEGGRVTPKLFERFRQQIAVLAAEPDTFWTDQFNNTDSLDGYARIGEELLRAGRWLASRVLRRGRHWRHVERRRACASSGGQPGAHRRAGARIFTGDDGRPRRAASRGGHRHRPHSTAHGAPSTR